MNFLEMVQKSIRWSGVRSTEPTTLVNPSGLVQNMADQVSAAWEELQLERSDWKWNTAQSATGIITSGSGRFFLRESAASGGTDNKISGMITYSTTDGSASLTSATLADLQYYIKDCSVGINDTTTTYVPEDTLQQIDWEDWEYHDEQADETGQPRYYSISPNGELVVYPIPDEDYRLFFVTPRVPQVLEADADEITDIPEFMQKGVIWRGILYYGLYIQDTGIIEYARLRYRPYKKWLEASEMPDVTLGDPGTY